MRLSRFRPFVAAAASVVLAAAVVAVGMISPNTRAAAATGGVRTMGFIGCSMAENVAQGYVATGGTRMWGPYGTNARQHAAPNATIYITGQPLYDAGHTCPLAGANGPQLTDNLARQAGADATQKVTYPGAFRLRDGEDSDGCHANAAGQASLGRQAIAFWG